MTGVRSFVSSRFSANLTDLTFSKIGYCYFRLLLL